MREIVDVRKVQLWLNVRISARKEGPELEVDRWYLILSDLVRTKGKGGYSRVIHSACFFRC